MRRDLLALSIFLLFLGVVFISGSRVVVKPEPLEKWVVVEEARATAEQTSSLFVQGSLDPGDRFRVIFELAPPSPGFLSLDTTVLVNLTHPNGYTEPYYIPIERDESGMPQLMASFPEGVANYTGTYKASAEAILGIFFNSLSLQKMELEEREVQLPYGILLPVGIVILFGGVGISILGAKISMRKRTRYKRPLRKRKR